MYRIPWFWTEHVGLKLGLYEGKPGAGIELDYDLFDGYPLHLEFEIRDAYDDADDEDIDEEISGPMTRIRARASPTSRESVSGARSGDRTVLRVVWGSFRPRRSDPSTVSTTPMAKRPAAPASHSDGSRPVVAGRSRPTAIPPVAARIPRWK